MVHYLADWRSRTDSIITTPTIWNEVIDHFDVEGLAKQINETGAGYFIFTIGQNSGAVNYKVAVDVQLVRIVERFAKDRNTIPGK